MEVPRWTAENKTSLNTLHQALLDQCRLLGSQPYPYVLHRAHEEAIIHLDEKEDLTNLLTYYFQQVGVEFSGKSHKLSAKELKKRKRMK